MIGFRTINPSTEELLREFPFHSKSEVLKSLEGASNCFSDWRKTSFSKRAEYFLKLEKILLEKCEVLAAVITLEMGKPFRMAKSEIEKCALTCRYFAENSEKLLRSELVESSQFGKAEKHYRPLGPVLAIMPWNYPFYQVFRFAVPNIMAGNCCLLKHSPNTPLCALEIEKLFLEAGLPTGCFQSIFVNEEQCRDLIEDDRIAGVNLTGSVQAGKSVAAQAGRQIKKLVLELGGSDPLLVFSDSNIPMAAQAAANARCSNSGQVCCAPKRLFVQQSAKEEFIEAYLATISKKIVADPTQPETDMGPMARKDLRDSLDQQIQCSIEQGAKEFSGAESVPEKGYFRAPSLLVGGGASNLAAREELFGPVAWLDSFEKEDEAIFRANDTVYGLAASVWTESSEKAERVSAALEVGTVVVNGSVTSDPALPFGGVKQSGFGKELGEEGIKEFLNTQLVWKG